MQVFPNPGPGRFTVRFSRPVSGSIAWSVRDMVGRLLAQGRHTGGEQMAIALPPSVADGVYVLTVKTGEGGDEIIPDDYIWGETSSKIVYEFP